MQPAFTVQCVWLGQVSLPVLFEENTNPKKKSTSNDWHISYIHVNHRRIGGLGCVSTRALTLVVLSEGQYRLPVRLLKRVT